MSTPLTSCNWGLRLELPANLREVLQTPKNLLLGPTFNKEKALGGAFYGHCDNSAKVRCQLYSAPRSRSPQRYAGPPPGRQTNRH